MTRPKKIGKSYLMIETIHKTDFWKNFFLITLYAFVTQFFIYFFGLNIFGGNTSWNTTNIIVTVLLVLNSMFIAFVLSHAIKETYDKKIEREVSLIPQ